MSFEEDSYVDIDYHEGLFSMISLNGNVRTYEIDKESALLDNILNAYKRGELEVYRIDRESYEDEDWDFRW